MSRKALYLGLVLFASLLASQTPTATTEALLSPLRRGYFSGTYGPPNLDIGKVLTNGLMDGSYPSRTTARSTVLDSDNWAYTDLTDKAGFIAYIEGLYDGGGRDRTGAAFIIQNMRGVASPNGEANYPTPSEIQHWKDLINQPSVTLDIVANPGGTTNSAYMEATLAAEISWHYQPLLPRGCTTLCLVGSSSPPGYPYSGCKRPTDPILNTSGTAERWRCTHKYYRAVADVMFFDTNLNLLPALVFRQDDLIRSKIKINCGNMIDSIGLRDDPDPWQYSIKASNDGHNKPGETIRVEGVYSNSSGINGAGLASWHNIEIVPTTNAGLVTYAGSAWTNSGGTNSVGRAHWTNFGPIISGTSGTFRANWSIAAGASDGTRICFKAIGSPKGGLDGSVDDWGGDPPSAGSTRLSDKTCITVDNPTRNWNYQARTLSGTTANETSVFPGGTIKYVSDVLNSPATMAGPAYTHTISPTKGSGSITPSTAGTWTGASIAAGANTTDHTRTFTVNSSVADGTEICIDASVTPVAGNSVGGTTNSGTDLAGERCYTVTRNTYNYVPTIDVSGGHYPNDNLTVTGDITNDGTGGVGHPYEEKIYVWRGMDQLVSDAEGVWAESGLANTDTRDHNKVYTIKNDADHGEEICFSTWVNPSTGLATPGTTTDEGGPAIVNQCITVTRNFYDYVPTIDVAINHTDDDIDNDGDYYPGVGLTITGVITNDGTGGTGPNYRQSIYVNGGEEELDNGYDAGVWDDETGLLNEEAETHEYTYTIKDDAEHGEWICFNTDVNPSQGYATPGDITVTKGWINVWECIQVNNERFDLGEPVITMEDVAQPGDDVDIEYYVCNRDTGFITAGSDRGIAPSVAITSSGDLNPGIDTTQDIGTDDPDDCWSIETTMTIPVTANVGDRLCTKITISKDYGFSDGTQLGGIMPQIKEECLVVAVAPYLRVDNGDIWAGANFENVTPPNIPVEPTCGSGNADSEIRSVTKEVGGAWHGSYVEYAAVATGAVEGFGSNGSPAWDTLTFANDPSPGNYTDDPRCIPNYYELLKNYSGNSTPASNDFNIDDLTDETQYFKTGDVSLTDETAAFNKQITLVTEGNITIEGDIKYSAAYGDIDSLNIPSLVLVASGNIYIDQSVTQIDAILISQGDTGIWTCSNGSTPITEVAENICAEPLTINGALIANRINFMRTHEGGGRTGGVHDPNSGPAEIVNFSPEFYLSSPIFRSNLLNENELRTVLFKDLPPIY